MRHICQLHPLRTIAVFLLISYITEKITDRQISKIRKLKVSNFVITPLMYNVLIFYRFQSIVTFYKCGWKREIFWKEEIISTLKIVNYSQCLSFWSRKLTINIQAKFIVSFIDIAQGLFLLFLYRWQHVLEATKSFNLILSLKRVIVTT